MKIRTSVRNPPQLGRYKRLVRFGQLLAQSLAVSPLCCRLATRRRAVGLHRTRSGFICLGDTRLESVNGGGLKVEL